LRDTRKYESCSTVDLTFAMSASGKTGANVKSAVLRAVVCRELGPPGRLRLETFSSKPLGPGQVRVAIRAAGINFPDILMAAGEYQLKPELPFTPGMEAAGDVVEVNGADGVAIGDRVIVKLRHGGYSDEAVVSPSQLTPLPSTFDYAE